MNKPYDRLPLCGVTYIYGGKANTCRRAKGHSGKHRVSREAWSDEQRIKNRMNQ